MNNEQGLGVPSAGHLRPPNQALPQQQQHHHHHHHQQQQHLHQQNFRPVNPTFTPPAGPRPPTQAGVPGRPPIPAGTEPKRNALTTISTNPGSSSCPCHGPRDAHASCRSAHDASRSTQYASSATTAAFTPANQPSHASYETHESYSSEPTASNGSTSGSCASTTLACI